MRALLPHSTSFGLRTDQWLESNRRLSHLPPGPNGLTTVGQHRLSLQGGSKTRFVVRSVDGEDEPSLHVEILQLHADAPASSERSSSLCVPILRILVYLVIYDSGWVSLEHPLLSRYPSNSESITG